MNTPYNCDLFKNLEENQVDQVFKSLKTHAKTYKKDEIIFKN